jgi:hypothetical protein
VGEKALFAGRIKMGQKRGIFRRAEKRRERFQGGVAISLFRAGCGCELAEEREWGRGNFAEKVHKFNKVV